MQVCPNCEFLMDDDEEVCQRCRDTGGGGVPAAAGAGGVLTATRPVGTLLDAPPAPRVLDDDDAPLRTTRWRRPAVVALVVVVAVAGLVAAGARDRGPLAVPLQELGLVEEPAVRVPGSWVAVTGRDGSFSAQLPTGARPVEESTAGVASSGFRVGVGEDAHMAVLTTPLEGGFQESVRRQVEAGGLGTATVLREVPDATGAEVLDAVLVLDDRITTRARFVARDGRFHALLTRGPDSGADALDEAHARLVDSFDAAD